MRKCCGNCSFNINTESDNILENSALNGEECCLLGNNHYGKFVCSDHEYKSDLLKNYVLYDDKYLGQGYFIVTEYAGEVVKFLKLYRTGEYNEYSYNIMGYDREPINIGGKKMISLNLSDTFNEKFILSFKEFADRLGSDIICEHSTEEKSALIVDVNNYSACLTLMNNYGRNRECKSINFGFNEKFNDLVSILYRDLACISCNKTEKDVVKRVLKITK